MFRCILILEKLGYFGPYLFYLFNNLEGNGKEIAQCWLFYICIFNFSKKFKDTASVSDPDSDPGQWIRIRIRIQDPDPGGQKWPTKIEKSEEISSFEVLDVLF